MINLTMNSSVDVVLKSSEVRDLTGTMLTNLKKIISERISILNNEINSGGLNSQYKVNGEAIFYNASSPIKEQYEKLLEDIQSLVDKVDTAAIETEEEELIRLKNLLTKKKERLSEEVAGESDAKSKNQTYKAKYDWSPILFPNFKEMASDTDAKLSEVNKRLKNLGEWKSYEDAAAAGYSGILTKEEFQRRKARKGTEYDKYDSYEDYVKAMSKKYKGTHDSKSYYERLHVTKQNKKLSKEVTDNKDKWKQTGTGEKISSGETTNDNKSYTYTTASGQKVDVETNSNGTVLYFHTISDNGFDVYYDQSGNPIPKSTTQLLSAAGNYTANSSKNDVWTKSPDQSGVKKGLTKYIYSEDNHSKVYAVGSSEGVPTYYIVKQSDGSEEYYSILFRRITKKEVEDLERAAPTS